MTSPFLVTSLTTNLKLSVFVMKTFELNKTIFKMSDVQIILTYWIKDDNKLTKF